jgi:hypothetical protein
LMPVRTASCRSPCRLHRRHDAGRPHFAVVPRSATRTCGSEM